MRLDARAVTSRAHNALRRRRRRIRSSIVAMSGAIVAYVVVVLASAFAGPLPVPGLGTVNVPGGGAVRAVVRDLFPGLPPGPGQWPEDVDRIETELLPVVQELGLDYYLNHPGPCYVLEYSRGDYADGNPEECRDLVPFDAQVWADYNRVTAAIERTGVAVERIYRQNGAIYIPIEDYSWQYNWVYVLLPGATSPPATNWPEEEWTHIRGDWWFFQAHDD
jgi:hypothetical protein